MDLKYCFSVRLHYMGGVASLRMFDWTNAETYGEIKADVTINTGSGGMVGYL